MNESEGIEDDQVSSVCCILRNIIHLCFSNSLSDTVVVFTVNYADYGSVGVFLLTRSAHYEKSKFLGSGGSMVARLKLKEIDGRAPQGVEPAA